MIVVVVGTGTEVGKTTFTTAWLRRLRRLGRPVVGWKPIETGGDADERALGEACGQRLVAAHRFPRPVSPHLEARRLGVRIDLRGIVDRARGLEKAATHLLVETAGGLFSPLDDEGRTNAELAEALGGNWVLVARNRLGVLHDVEACRRGLGGRTWDALVLTEGAAPDESQSTNAEELARRTCRPLVGDFQRTDDPVAPLDPWFV